MSLKKEVQKIETATKTIQAYLPRLSTPKIIRDIFFYIWAGVLAGIFFLSLALNFFLDSYYSIPEPNKYIKISAYQTALKVAQQVNQNLEQEEQKRLAEIKPKGILRGVLVNHQEGSLNTITVNGSLAALAVNSKIGIVNAKPLQFSNNYQKGVESSYLTGNKYYDVDLKVSGVQKALLVHKSGYEEDYEMNLFTASIGLIEQADQVLKINLESFLNRSNDREYSLRTYLAHLTSVEKSIKNTQLKVDKEITRLSNEESVANAKMLQTESDFFIALNKFDQKNTYKNLDQFIIDFQTEVDKKARLQAMNQIEKYFSAYLPILTERREAVQANRNALVHGIKVVAFRDVDLGLITVAN